MRTALRTFSPIPSLQQDEASRKDLSDAPRIKAILKACYLDHEVADQAPSNLKAVAMKAVSYLQFSSTSSFEFLCCCFFFENAGLLIYVLLIVRFRLRLTS